METTWDLTPLFPGLESPEFQRAWEGLKGRIGELKGLLEREAPLPEVLAALDAFLEEATPLRAYLYARYSADTRDEAALAKLSELEILFLDFQRLRPRLTRYLALKDPEEAGPHRLLVEEAKEEAEAVAAEAVAAAEAADAGRADREVALLRRLELGGLLVVHDRAHQQLRLLGRQVAVAVVVAGGAVLSGLPLAHFGELGFAGVAAVGPAGIEQLLDGGAVGRDRKSVV